MTFPGPIPNPEPQLPNSHPLPMAFRFRELGGRVRATASGFTGLAIR